MICYSSTPNNSIGGERHNSFSLHHMIIECKLTNAADLVRERVVLLTGMRLLIDDEKRLF
jgi:hypothetical protein